MRILRGKQYLFPGLWKNEFSLVARFNNFQFLRIAAATSVIFSHSFLLADGNELAEPLTKMLGDKNVFGIYGVFIFFFISGFLITNSALHSRSIASFVTRRFLRIYPGLGACAFLSAAIFGSLFTERTLSEFWRSLIPFRYTWNTLKDPIAGWIVNGVVSIRGRALVARIHERQFMDDQPGN